MSIAGLDHLVLTVADLEQTIAFYVRAIGLEHIGFGEGRHALRCGQQKINLHPATDPIQPHAAFPTPGAADLCLLLNGHLEEAIERLKQAKVAVELGPIQRTGSQGPIRSIYVRDPDQNLIELAEQRPCTSSG